MGIARRFRIHFMWHVIEKFCVVILEFFRVPLSACLGVDSFQSAMFASWLFLHNFKTCGMLSMDKARCYRWSLIHHTTSSFSSSFDRIAVPIVQCLVWLDMSTKNASSWPQVSKDQNLKWLTVQDHLTVCWCRN
jgi:hypothetical protein